jgi:hypothetical protein
MIIKCRFQPNDFQNRQHQTKSKLLARILTALADGEASVTVANGAAVRRALELGGIEFIDDNGGGPRLTFPETPAGEAGQVIDNWPSHSKTVLTLSGK